MSIDYDTLSDPYHHHRVPDIRIAARIWVHTRDNQHLLNVGAGMGAYEPENCAVVALEPSLEMVTKRKQSAATMVQGFAENLPFKDHTFQVAMGILTIHHWADISTGLHEMLRVSQKKIILFTWIGYDDDFWLEDYIPDLRGVDQKLFPSLKELEAILGRISVEKIEIPHDCTDGFMCAYWRRPEAYLDANVRKAISTFSRIPDVQKELEKLRQDISDGSWRKKYHHLLDKESLDLGYRLVVCDKGESISCSAEN